MISPDFHNAGATQTPQNRAKTPSTVFFVDDDPLVLEVVSGALVREGYEVDCTTDAREAIERLAMYPEKYEVLISDFDMPEVTGKELIASIKSNGFHGKTVIYSGRVANGDEAWRKSTGADALVEKLGTESLLAVLKQLTNGKPASFPGMES